MRFAFTPENEAFRAEIRAFLATHVGDEVRDEGARVDAVEPRGGLDRGQRAREGGGHIRTRTCRYRAPGRARART